MYDPAVINLGNVVGPPGAKGDPGEQGVQGEQGAPGKDGTRFFPQEDEPLGKSEGDVWYKPSSGDLKTLTAGGTWELVTTNDDEVTESSVHPVKSSGIYSAIEASKRYSIVPLEALPGAPDTGVLKDRCISSIGAFAKVSVPKNPGPGAADCLLYVPSAGESLKFVIPRCVAQYGTFDIDAGTTYMFSFTMVAGPDASGDALWMVSKAELSSQPQTGV